MDSANSEELTAVKSALYNHDLSTLKSDLVTRLGWTHREAAEGIDQYRNFIFLKRKYTSKKLPPSKNIDDIWHTHIIHTQDYHAFCAKVFNNLNGYYLHHTPAHENDGISYEKSFELTQNLYKQEFGTYIYDIKGNSFLSNLLVKSRRLLTDNFPEIANIE